MSAVKASSVSNRDLGAIRSVAVEAQQPLSKLLESSVQPVDDASRQHYHKERELLCQIEETNRVPQWIDRETHQIRSR